MARTSRKHVETLIGWINAELYGYQYRYICHQNLGNRANYYYTYSLIRDNTANGNSTVIFSDTSLKEVSEYLERQFMAISRT